MNGTSVLLGFFIFVYGFLFSLGKIKTNSSYALNIGEVLALSGVILFISGLFPQMKSHWLFLSIISWITIVGFDLWYVRRKKMKQK